MILQIRKMVKYLKLSGDAGKSKLVILSLTCLIAMTTDSSNVDKMVFKASKGRVIYTLILFDNNSFEYNVDEGAFHIGTSGTWTRKEGGITLNSYYQKGERPKLCVVENYNKNQEKSYFSKIVDIYGYEIPFYTIYLNNNDTDTCNVGFLRADNCNLQGIDSFSIYYDNNRSEVYKIKDKKSNSFEVQLMAPNRTDSYIFIKNESVKIRDNKILFRGLLFEPLE